MRVKLRSQVKIITAIFISVVIYNEYLVYIFQSYTWPKMECSQNDDCVKIILVADPQILGEQSQDAPLKYLFNWDSDRYLSKTFSKVLSKFNPNAVLFLGDMMDEGTVATNKEFHSYVKRLLTIFTTEYPIKHVWIPGDNDIGGENEPIYPGKVKQFNSAFMQPDIINIKNVDIFKVNLIMQKLPKLLSDHVSSLNKTNIAVSHMPLLISPGRFTETVLTKIKPGIIFSGHKHTALHLETTLEAMFVSKVISMIPQDVEKVVKIEFAKEVYHEFIVPTCSYRMGVPYMGYGVAIIDGNNKNLRYSIFWSPRRFEQLRTYLIVLCLFVLYLTTFIFYKVFIALYTRICHRSILWTKI